jgi:hypothetical protein
MWVCESAAAPGVLFSSTSDRTNFLPGWTCKKLQAPLPSGGPTQWATWYKIARLIESLPF